MDLARQLDRAAADARAGELARVFAHEVDVELLTVERAPECVERELRPTEQALRVHDHEVSPRCEVVAAREVHPWVHRRDALRQAPRLEDPVVRPRVAERRVPSAVQEPDLAEQRGDAALRLVAPAGFALVARAAAIVPQAGAGAPMRLELVAAEAPGGGFDLATRRTGAPARHQVHRGAERVASQQYGRPVHDLHPLNVLE